MDTLTFKKYYFDLINSDLIRKAFIDNNQPSLSTSYKNIFDDLQKFDISFDNMEQTILANKFINEILFLSKERKGTSAVQDVYKRVSQSLKYFSPLIPDVITPQFIDKVIISTTDKYVGFSMYDSPFSNYKSDRDIEKYDVIYSLEFINNIIDLNFYPSNDFLSKFGSKISILSSNMLYKDITQSAQEIISKINKNNLNNTIKTSSKTKKLKT